MPCMRNSKTCSAGDEISAFSADIDGGGDGGCGTAHGDCHRCLTYYAPESMSVEEAKHIALHRAKTEAIAAEFGTTVTQLNTVVTATDNAATDTRLYSVGGSEVRGEWIETISEPDYQISYDKGVLTVSVSVRGLIREPDLSAPEIEIATFRNGLGSNNESGEFRDGDDFYMTARASTDGYMVAYLLDEKARTAYRILPYQQVRESSVRLNAGLIHAFFSTEGVDEMTRSTVDTYTLTCDEKVEFNRLYIIFSETPVSITTNESKRDDELPFEVDESRFHNWLLKKRSSPGVRVVERTIKISAR